MKDQIKTIADSVIEDYKGQTFDCGQDALAYLHDKIMSAVTRHLAEQPTGFTKNESGGYDYRFEPPDNSLDEAKKLTPFHGCLTGDCPHNNANECVEALKEYVAQMEQNELELQHNGAKVTKERDDANARASSAISTLAIEAITSRSLKQQLEEAKRSCDTHLFNIEKLATELAEERKVADAMLAAFRSGSVEEQYQSIKAHQQLRAKGTK